MVVGFNHNFKYNGTVYHIQTEDGGLGSPNIVTLLYHGGTILASRKTSYADILKADHLEKVVEDLMKEQHKEMLRNLRSGEFDEVIARFAAGRKAAEADGKAQATPAPAKHAGVPAEQPQVVGAKARVAEATEKPQAKPSEKSQGQPQDKPQAAAPRKPDVAASLDEIVLSYLMGDEKQ